MTCWILSLPLSSFRLLLLFSFCLPCVLCLNNVQSSHLPSIGLSSILFLLKHVSILIVSIIIIIIVYYPYSYNYTRKDAPTINNNTADLLLHAVCVVCFPVNTYSDWMNEQLTVGGQYSFNLISLKRRLELVLLLFLLFGRSFGWTIDASKCINEEFSSSSFLFLLLFHALHHMVSLIVDVFVFVWFLYNVICTMKLIDILVLFFYFYTIGT